ncbi:MAG: universal stress protein [Verrucomicrobiota bacterium]|nr:universal stress protein [Verrucomicrobiota bacterium]
MYRKILVALENSNADEAVMPHVAALAKLHGAELLLVHVADGFAARNFDQLKLVESDEMKADRAYLEKAAEKLRAQGATVHAKLELGDPAMQIVKIASAENCDLIAMASHGHRLIGDILHGSTINEVRHKTAVPLLLVRAAR